MEAMVGVEVDALEGELRSETFLDREVAATRLAAAGPEGHQVLARIAADDSAAPPVRVTALRHLPAAQASPDLLRRLLETASAVIRVLALEKVEQARATTLTAAVERLTRDPATFWDLDEEIAVAQVAARVLAALEGSGGVSSQ